jgi:hypothetical protein
MRKVSALAITVFFVWSTIATKDCLAGQRRDRFSVRELRDGDLVFQQSQSNQSDAIREATGSDWTHVGICWMVNAHIEVVEAAGLQVTSVSVPDFVRRGEAQRVVVRRLRDRGRQLTNAGVRRLRRQLAEYLGRPYDPYFSWDDAQLYCSELIWKSYQSAFGISLSEPQRMADLNYRAPEVEKLIIERFHATPGDARWNEILHEKVVTPVALLKSDQLVTVYDGTELSP